MSTIHVVGGGLAGMASALALADAGRAVTLHEGSGHLGGRCRSFHDRRLDAVIDNGTHVLVGANRAALAFLDRIGTRDGLLAVRSLPFADADTNETWDLRLDGGAFGLLPLPGRRLPGVPLRDHTRLWRLLWPKRGRVVADGIDPRTPLGRRLVEPLTLAVMNAPPSEASASLLGRVLRKTLLAGGSAGRVYVARDGLGACLVDPAERALRQAGVAIALNRRLIGLERTDRRLAGLRFAGDTVDLDDGDGVVLALPWHGLARILPAQTGPEGQRAIVNLHFRLDGPARLVRGGPVLGLIGTMAQWLFVRGDIASVTISAADAGSWPADDARAGTVWREIRRHLVDPPNRMPPCRVIAEKRATFVQSPEQVARRPSPRTGLRNLVLAGDWTDTGLPATIEGAIGSGRRAAGYFAAQTRPAVIQNPNAHPISGVP
ncbi:hydroxysqualene dehydroxylase HpnE [Marinivivus vitaminiproducens]|uniref:hydroxysqualene dehydroxylase HpnE n=1 Tax=Marinivivus vitaminiproducens TaxID=3035935 RepID=UPI0027AA29E8|nr:hydroxysqualene dehydroxylase HpnE [Geminicoccaceae bacterium SCSIO 64248]